MKKLVVLTGQTGFMGRLSETIEELLGCNFMMLQHRDADNIEYWLNLADGVIFPGGVDVHPATYGEDVTLGDNLTKFDRNRDFAELTAVEFCKKNGVPAMGICRGHQLLAVAHGIKLIKNIKTGIAHNPSKEMDMPPHVPAHKVTSLGDPTIVGYVNSYHHQGFLASDVYNYTENDDRHHPDLIANAIAADGICEAMTIRNCNIFSVQWHPEGDWQVNPFSRELFMRFRDMIG